MESLVSPVSCELACQFGVMGLGHHQELAIVLPGNHVSSSVELEYRASHQKVPAFIAFRHFSEWFHSLPPRAASGVRENLKKPSTGPRPSVHSYQRGPGRTEGRRGETVR